MASLLANFSGQISKWQQPTPAAVETNLSLVEFFQAASKSFFPLSETSFNLL